ncbi:hypothetical protein [Fibrobacter sp.]|uniref:hypothetical protein n=1 Tax=Fibrobacter sp. TaxID=35828 RepID=UPI00388EFF7B
MLFTPTGTFYSKVQFKTEEEVEKVVVDNFKLLFGDYSLLLPKSLIRTSGGKGTVPDGIIVDFKGNRWFILEVERGDHETWGHIAPQISKQLVAVMHRETKNKIAELCIAEIGKQKKFSRLLESDLKIQQISPSRTTTNGWVTPWSRQWRLRSLPEAPETASPSGRIRIGRN